MKRKYFWQYPRAALRQIRSNVAIGVLFLGPFLFLSGGGASYNVEALLTNGFAWLPLLSLMIQVPIFALCALATVVPTLRFFLGLFHRQLPVSIQAYRRGYCLAIPDPRDSENHYGEYLAQHCRELDDVADKVGAIPLYELGIRQYGATNVPWFSAGVGIATVDRLLEFLRSSDFAVVHREEIVRDLEMLRNVLEKSEEFYLMVV